MIHPKILGSDMYFERYKLSDLDITKALPFPSTYVSMASGSFYLYKRQTLL